MPDFKHDDFALLDGQFGEATHRGAFCLALLGGALEPAPRFHLTRQPPPQGAAIIERAISETAHAIMLQLRGTLGLLHQNDKGFLQDVLGFGMAQAEGAAVKDQFRGLRFVELLAPML